MQTKHAKFSRFQAVILVILGILILGFGGLRVYQYKIQKPSASRRPSIDRPIAYYFRGTEIQEIISSEGNQGEPLPDELIISPGSYRVYGQNYNLDKEGLYRFLDPPNSNQQRIVYKDNIPGLMSAISWIASHGLADKGKTSQELLEKAKTEKLSINCGDVALFVLKNLNIKARIVTTLTLEEWNSYDTGHTMLEVFDDSRWQVYDLDNNVRLLADGQPLNFLEFAERASSGDYQIEKIADDADYAVRGSNKAGYDYSFYFEAILSNEETLRKWYQKVIQVPLIGEYPTYYFFDKENRERIESYASNYKFMPRDEFMRKFYP
ncbi:MAG: transglutaminase domain-containing protein [Patescibacteria group bacterium]